MASYLLQYGIIFIGIWHHNYWIMASYLLECGIIFIGMWYHIYWNMASYLLEYDSIFIGICCHIYWNMLSYLLEYVILFIGICHHIYLLLNSNSDKNYIQKHYKRKISMRNIAKQQQKHLYINERLQRFSIFLKFVLLLSVNIVMV